jgi:hypothetical protein
MARMPCQRDQMRALRLIETEHADRVLVQRLRSRQLSPLPRFSLGFLGSPNKINRPVQPLLSCSVSQRTSSSHDKGVIFKPDSRENLHGSLPTMLAVRSLARSALRFACESLEAHGRAAGVPGAVHASEPPAGASERQAYWQNGLPRAGREWIA